MAWGKCVAFQGDICDFPLLRLLAVGQNGLRFSQFNKSLSRRHELYLFGIVPLRLFAEPMQTIPTLRFRAPHSMAARFMTRPLAVKYSPLSLSRSVRLYSQSVPNQYENILVDQPKPGVGISKYFLFNIPIDPRGTS